MALIECWILTFKFLTSLAKKVCYNEDDKVIYGSQSLEYADEYLVPRSSSVVVKRVPLMKGAKSRFGRYLSGGGPRYVPNAPNQQSRAPAPVALWTKGTGAISKRFDGKEDPKVTAVSNLFYSLIQYLPQHDVLCL